MPKSYGGKVMTPGKPKQYRKGTGAASPEIGAPTRRYGKGQSRNNMKAQKGFE